MRFCPRCEGLSGDEADYCNACGYRLVLYPRFKMSREQKLQQNEKKQPRYCIYCGSRCKGIACGYHADLLDLDPERGAPPD